MEKNSDLTRQKLLAAGLREFAAYGMAGSRVDRIARDAGCNKQLIYAYFTNKEGLFIAVFDQVVDEVMADVPFDARDLPGYAARLATLFAKRPEVIRMNVWRRLERLIPESEAIRKITRKKIRAIKSAQDEGVVGRRYDPKTLLALISQIAMTGALALPGQGGADTAERAEIEAIVSAVRLLCE